MSEFLDPCQEAAAKSIKCLNRNDGDRSMCQDYFQYTFFLPRSLPWAFQQPSSFLLSQGLPRLQETMGTDLLDRYKVLGDRGVLTQDTD